MRIRTMVTNASTRPAYEWLQRRQQASVYGVALSRDEFIDYSVGGALEELLLNFGGATKARLQELTDRDVQQRLAWLLEDVESRRNTEESN